MRLSRYIDEGHPDGVIDLYAYAARVHVKQNNLDSAHIYLNKAKEELSESSGSHSYFSFVEGELAKAEGRCADALAYFNRVQSYFDTDPDYWSIIRIKIEKVGCLLSKKDLEGAFGEVNYTDSLNKAVVNSMLFEVDLLELKRQLFGLKGDYQRAFTYGNKIKHVQDSLHAIDFGTAYIDFEGQYMRLKAETAKQEAEILRIQNGQQSERAKTMTLVMLLTLLLALVLGVLVWVYKRKTQQEREEGEFKNKVVSVLSHDIRTPLSQVQGVLELIQNNPEDYESVKALLPKLSASVQNSKEEILTILEWARKELVGIDPVFSEFDIHEVVEEAIAFNKQSIRDRDIQIETDILSTVKVKADKNHINIALRNILNNAIKYSLVHGTIQMSLAESDAGYALSVRDFGKGMSKELQAALFTQGIGADKASGSGIGLYLTKSLLDANGVSITFRSKEGEGSTFTLLFPKQT